MTVLPLPIHDMRRDVLANLVCEMLYTGRPVPPAWLEEWHTERVASGLPALPDDNGSGHRDSGGVVGQ